MPYFSARALPRDVGVGLVEGVQVVGAQGTGGLDVFSDRIHELDVLFGDVRGLGVLLVLLLLRGERRRRA